MHIPQKLFRACGTSIHLQTLLVYINDRAPAKDIFLFADDTTIAVSSLDIASSVDNLKEVFKKLESRMRPNQTQLNKSKTEIIIRRSDESDQSRVETIENVNPTKLARVLLISGRPTTEQS